MSEPPPSVHAELVWAGDHRFAATSGSNALVVDGRGGAGASPMQLVAIGVAGCMAIDVVAILEKGRHALRGLRVSLDGTRLPEVPRCFTAFALHFHVTGDVPDEAVERAIDLSRTKYCSAWLSIRGDVTMTTAFTIARE